MNEIRQCVCCGIRYTMDEFGNRLPNGSKDLDEYLVHGFSGPCPKPKSHIDWLGRIPVFTSEHIPGDMVIVTNGKIDVFSMAKMQADLALATARADHFEKALAEIGNETIPQGVGMMFWPKKVAELRTRARHAVAATPKEGK